MTYLSLCLFKDGNERPKRNFEFPSQRETETLEVGLSQAHSWDEIQNNVTLILRLCALLIMTLAQIALNLVSHPYTASSDSGSIEVTFKMLLIYNRLLKNQSK